MSIGIMVYEHLVHSGKHCKKSFLAHPVALLVQVSTLCPVIWLKCLILILIGAVRLI